MKRHFALLGFAIFAATVSAAPESPSALAPAPGIASNSDPALEEIQANAVSVPRYEKFELTFQAHGHWANPFDPDEVAIDCLVEPPHGAAIVVPAFFFQHYRREQIEGDEKLTADGAPCWKLRFTPVEAGTYRWHLRLQNAGRTIESPVATFECTANSNSHGFTRISRTNPRYFEYDDGAPFFVIGQNMLVPGHAATYAMDKWLTSLARAGGNFIRTWWCYSGMDIESRASTEPRRALGVYDLASAWRADHQIELAEKLGVVVMPTLEAQQSLRAGLWWERFTYNMANGGVITRPAEFFTSAKAAEFFRKRLRYIVARWSYSTAIFSWMFWNEVDSCNDYAATPIANWHRDMARYLRSIDPNRHPINTNYGNLDGHAEVDDLPETELVSTNLYTRHDTASSALWAARFMTARRPKPYLLSEFGLGHYDRWPQNDPTGIALHDGLWGAAFGGAAGGALVWEWDKWVDGQNLYHYYTPFAAVMKDVAFNRSAWKTVEMESLGFRDPQRAPYFTNVFFEGFSTNYAFTTCPNPRPEVFTVTPEGNVDRPECFNGALAPAGVAGAVDEKARNDAAVATRDSQRTLLITMPRDGQLVLHVPRLSGEQHPILEVKVDGQTVLHQALSRENPKATWDYFKQFPIPLAAGAHRVVVANAQPATAKNFWSDRFTVAYELTNYRQRLGPNLEFAGLQSDGCMLLWLRNPQFTWLFARLGRKIEPQPEGLLHLNHVVDGAYTVTWIDTLTGEVLRRDTAKADGGRLVLPTPVIAKSAVAKLLKVFP
ncbi:MAG TPA: DUF5060 domain-containing protein [Opitutaceae bacterium]|nr:DUF5060 domain-containing protein [Opitutaceae bacterium]